MSPVPAPDNASEAKNARRLWVIKLVSAVATSTVKATTISEVANVAGTAFVPSKLQSSGAKSARMLRATVTNR